MKIIGVAGGTGSGKTTVVKKIVDSLPPHYVAVMPLDSYYNDTTGMTDEARRAINFDHPDAFDWMLLIQHIKKLKAQQEKTDCHDSRNNSCNSAFVGACHTCVKLSVQYD